MFYFLKLGQAASLLLLLSFAFSKGLSQKALATAIVQTQSIDSEECPAELLTKQGRQQLATSQLKEVLQTFQKIVMFCRQNYPLVEAEAQVNLGIVYRDLGQYSQANSSLQRALALYRSDTTCNRENHICRKGEGRVLAILGDLDNYLGRTVEGLEGVQQALTILEELDSRTGQGEALYYLGHAYNSLSQYEQALEAFQKALTIHREIKDRLSQGRDLQSIGLVLRSLGKYSQALEAYEKALSINGTTGDRLGEGRILSGMGSTYYYLGQYTDALEMYKKSLAIRRDIGDRAGESGSLNGLGIVYARWGQYSKAQRLHQQALHIGRIINHLSTQSDALRSLAGIHYAQGKYPQALKLYQEALEIVGRLKDRRGESTILSNLGGIYNEIGQHSQAIDQYRQSLKIRRAIGDLRGEASTLNNLGVIYRNLEQFFRARETFQEALKIRQEIGDRPGEGATLSNIGLVRSDLGQPSKALADYKQALTILQAVGDRPNEAIILSNLGIVYYELDQVDRALQSFEQALAVVRETGNRSTEILVLSNIGYLLSQQGQPELAIAFYKQSINQIEAIRQDLKVLELEQQQSYTNTIEDIYRALADLLLSQGRVLEAQQVLELLKVEELRRFQEENIRSEVGSGIATNSLEFQALKAHKTLIALGRQVEQCQQADCPQLSQLLDRRETISEQFAKTVRSLEKVIRNRRQQDVGFFDPNNLARQSEEIFSAQPATVFIQSLVLEDKLWILWASKGGITQSIEIPKVGQKRLSNQVLQFRQLLQDPTSNRKDVQQAAKRLHDWLIPPKLQQELQQNSIENLVFSLDHVTRYIPVSALFDGEDYLVERYNLSTIISAGLTDFRNRLPPGQEKTAVLALGLSREVPGFNPLPNVPAELDAIVQQSSEDAKGIYPGKAFLDREFTWKALRDNLAQHQVLHIATHGKFVAGSAYDSYLVMGTGEKLPIPKIQSLRDLGKIHLVVLSACQTALGGSGEDGTEISGLSHYFLGGGAKAAIASLWYVDDKSTRLLMERFYENLSQGTEVAPVTKAEALRRAQLSLLHGSTPTATTDNPRSLVVIEDRPVRQAASASRSRYAHPYYWAPFILIGNSL